MDPNANLSEQLALALDIIDSWDNCNEDGTLTPNQAQYVANQANRLSELVVALDGWIKSGGFLPAKWGRK